MNKQNEITDEEFVPFLHSLGVETFKKSFEWMLSDPQFAGVFTWLYDNLDHNNSLTAREKCRYTELQKIDKLLSPEDLEASISTIQEDFPGICLPGDRDDLEDVKFDIQSMKERLHALERQENITKDLIKKNEIVNERLTIEISQLSAAEQQCKEDESAAAAESLELAEEVETLTEGVVDVIAEALDIYARCHDDKDIAKKFIAFGPLEPYRQSQALFRSHFDLYTTRKFTNLTDEDLRAVLAEARTLEDRLSDAALAYIESHVNLCGEQAKLELVTNYNNVHPTQIAALSLEAQSSHELSTLEEAILEQQIQSAVKELVAGRTRLAHHTVTAAAVAQREEVHSDLSHLVSVSTHALCIDRALYCAVRRALRSVQLAAQFAAQLAEHVQGQEEAQRARIASMNEIISAQEAATKNLKHSDFFLQTLNSILGVANLDHAGVIHQFQELVGQLKLAKVNVEQEYRRREQEIMQFKSSLKPLREHVYSGSTRQPRGLDRTAAELIHQLAGKIEEANKTVVELGAAFTNVKDGDKRKQLERKLWQWFLTDPSRLLAAIKTVPGFST